MSTTLQALPKISMVFAAPAVNRIWEPCPYLKIYVARGLSIL